MPNPIGLTPAQLIEVTGRKQVAKQCEALALMDIPFKIRHDGTPFVYIDSLKTDTLVGHVKKTPEATLNFE
jgi:tRNA (Thr-GGU) A37 N-methylase